MTDFTNVSHPNSHVGELHEEDAYTNPQLANKVYAKGIKLEFPHFSGSNPSAWIYKANQYFLYHQVPPGQMIFFALFHMEDDALILFQDVSEAGTFHS